MMVEPLFPRLHGFASPNVPSLLLLQIPEEARWRLVARSCVYIFHPLVPREEPERKVEVFSQHIPEIPNFAQRCLVYCKIPARHERGSCEPVDAELNLGEHRQVQARHQRNTVLVPGEVITNSYFMLAKGGTNLLDCILRY